MEVILLEKVDNLGNVGDKVTVRPGYGRNFLLPKGKATLATAENIAEMEARRAELEAREANELSAAQSRAEQLEQLQLTINARAGVEGKLFGSVGTADIAEAATGAGHVVERSEVRMPDGPIRIAGEYEVGVHLHSDVNAVIRVTVIPETDATAVALAEEVAAEEAEASEESDAEAAAEADTGSSAQPDSDDAGDPEETKDDAG